MCAALVILVVSHGNRIRCTTEESTAAVFGAVIQVNFTYDNVQAISSTQYNFDVCSSVCMHTHEYLDYLFFLGSGIGL